MRHTTRVIRRDLQRTARIDMRIAERITAGPDIGAVEDVQRIVSACVVGNMVDQVAGSASKHDAKTVERIDAWTTGSGAHHVHHAIRWRDAMEAAARLVSAVGQQTIARGHLATREDGKIPSAASSTKDRFLERALDGRTTQKQVHDRRLGRP